MGRYEANASSNITWEGSGFNKPLLEGTMGTFKQRKKQCHGAFKARDAPGFRQRTHQSSFGSRIRTQTKKHELPGEHLPSDWLKLFKSKSHRKKGTQTPLQHWRHESHVLLACLLQVRTNQRANLVNFYWGMDGSSRGNFPACPCNWNRTSGLMVREVGHIRLTPNFCQTLSAPACRNHGLHRIGHQPSTTG